MGLFRETKIEEDEELQEFHLPEIRKKETDLPLSETADKRCKETAESLLHEYRKIIPEDQRERIILETEMHSPEVISDEVYSRRYPENDPLVVGHYEGGGRIVLKEGQPEAVMHVATHETVHRAAYKEVNTADPKQMIYRTGLRECVHNQSGELLKDQGEALNEGFTEMYAVKELEKRQDWKARFAMTSYPEARIAAGNLQEVVGEKTVQEAYFGGNVEGLKKEVNRLSGTENGWEELVAKVDEVEFGETQSKRNDARAWLTWRMAEMTERKAQEKRWGK